MTISGTMLSAFMITLGVLLAGLATHGRFGSQPSLFTQAATTTGLPDPAPSAAPAPQTALQPPKARFVTADPAPAALPAKTRPDRPANPPSQAARKPAPKKQQALAAQTPRPHRQPTASGWSWGWKWPLFGN